MSIETPTPFTRPRRLRRTPGIRALTRETRLSASSLVYPLFVVEEHDVKREIPGLPGQYHYSPDRVCEAVAECLELGVSTFLLFGLPAEKDEIGSGAWADDGIVQQGVRAIRAAYPDVTIVTDVCLCEYTSHGHCGPLPESVMRDFEHAPEADKREAAAGPLNDATIKLLAKTAVSHARAGADIVAPSAMMDGQVAAIRAALDEAGFAHIPVMSYSAKYASAFYGPFREAAGSAPAFGNRKGYQMDPHNGREAIRESMIDEDEGADFLMVKPALAYLDVIASLREATDLPLVAYSVSGEYSLIKAAAAAGYVDEEAIVGECAVSIFRAGADILITYYAKELARMIAAGEI